MKINPVQFLLNDQIKLDTAKQAAQPLDEHANSRDLQLLKKSKELESVFLTQLIKSMEKTIPEGMGGGKSSLSNMMFSSVMGDAMSAGGGIGLSKIIYASLRSRGAGTDLPEMPGEDYLATMNLLQTNGFPGDEK